MRKNSPTTTFGGGASRALPLAALVALAACAPALPVERAYDGRVVEGRFVEPGAYAAFLRGAIAEAAGDAKEALAAYEDAARRDGGSAEVWTKVAEARCALDPADARARAAIARALALDPTSGAAWEAASRCALARGQLAEARDAALRAEALDPVADAASAFLARTSEARDGAAREAALALTATARDPVVAWDALDAWAEARGDVALEALALENLTKVAPARRDAIARSAEALAGAGEVSAARAVAAAAVDETDEAQPVSRLAGRLAVDEAIARGDADAVKSRAARARVGLDEAAARALLLGQPALAVALAGERARADPDAVGPRLVLAAVQRRDLLGAAAEARAGSGGVGRVAAATWVAFGQALVHAVSPPEARRSLAAIEHEPVTAGDDGVARGAVGLALRGAIDPGALSADGAIELAVARGSCPPGDPAAIAARGLDLRHEYLALACASPGSSEVRRLGARLDRAASRDRVVAAARALARLGAGGPVAAGASASLLSLDPGDPLLAAVALRLADDAGDAASAARAHASLAALL